WASAAEPMAQRRPSAVQLLPNFDELLVAFRDRTDALDPGLPPKSRVPQVILGHVIVRDGLVVGSYRRRDDRAVTTLALDLQVDLGTAGRQALERAVERFAVFLGHAVETPGLD